MTRPGATSPGPTAVVDAERLHRLLRRITDDATVLQGYAGADRSALLDDPVRLGHLKYVFVTLLEACIDAAQHVCASDGYGPPGSNAEAVQLLGRHGVLPVELADRMALAVRFRNVLVHGYAQVDDRRVVAHLDRLDDVAAYVGHLARLV